MGAAEVYLQLLLLRERGDLLYGTAVVEDGEVSVAGQDVLPHLGLDVEHVLLEVEQCLLKGGGRMWGVVSAVTELALSGMDGVWHEWLVAFASIL